MSTSVKVLMLAALAVISCKQSGNNDSLSSFHEISSYALLPVVSEPVIPGNRTSIVDFGAVPDGQTLNTEAFADAITSIAEKGGGTVIIPRGIWLTGPIILKSNINLHTEEGALVIFSPDKELYPLIETSFEGRNTYRCTSPVYGRDLENIAFTGSGIFDGTGEAWRPVKKEKLTESQWSRLIASGGVLSDDGKQWFPSQSYYDGQKISSMNVPDHPQGIEDYNSIKDFLRPVMISLVNCKKILFDGPVFQNSPAWCIHPLMCEDLTVRNITVRNPWFSQNGDGIDIESCKNSIVSDSNFDVGDDAICIKSGKDKEGRDRGIPTENLVISNCVVYHGHGGVTVGSEMSGGVSNVFVSNCTFIGTDVGIRFKSNRGRGGVVENVHFTDIDMINIPTQAISFNLYYGGLSVSEMMAQGNKDERAAQKSIVPPVTEETPSFRNITMKNIRCKGAFQAIFLQGLPEMNLQNITLENIDMEAENGLTCIDADGIKIKDMRLIVKNSPALNLTNTRNLDAELLKVTSAGDPRVIIKGRNSGSIRLSFNEPQGEGAVLTGEETDKSTITIL
jgi:polygalacturonase